jgi:hypothetical protein
MADQAGGRELAKKPSRRMRLRMASAEGGEGKLSVCKQFGVFVAFVWCGFLRAGHRHAACPGLSTAAHPRRSRSCGAAFCPLTLPHASAQGLHPRLRLPARLDFWRHHGAHRGLGSAGALRSALAHV